MTLQNNPIFMLACSVEKGQISRDEAFEKATTRTFLERLRNKTFREIFDAALADYSRTGPEPLPSHLTSIALLCAERKGLEAELRTMLSVAHAFLSIGHGDTKTALEQVAYAKRKLGAGRFAQLTSLCETVLLEACLIQGDDRIGSAFGQSGQPSAFGVSGLNFALQQLRLGTRLSLIGEAERAISHLLVAKAQFVRLMRSTLQYRFAYRKMLKSAQSEYKKFQRLHLPSLIACELGLSGSLFRLGKYDEALRRLLAVRHRCEQSGTAQSLMQMNLLYAATYRQLGDFGRAIKILEDSENSGSKHPLIHFQSRMFLVTLYCDIEQYNKALSLLDQTRLAAEKEGRLDQVAECHRKAAKIYWRLGEIETATDFCLSAKRIFEERGMDFDVAWCEADLASLEVHAGKYDRALKVFQELKSLPSYWNSPDSLQ